LREKASAEADNHDLIRLSSALAYANTPIRHGLILYFGTLPLDSIFHQLHSAHARRVSENWAFELSLTECGHRPESVIRTMLVPDFDPVLTAVQIRRCNYPAPCRAPRCAVPRATMVLRKV